MAAFVTGNFTQSANQIFRYQFGNGMDIITARKNQELVRNGKSPAEYFQQNGCYLSLNPKYYN
jgi:hypothetical protein